ncbi:putative wd repeat protein [Erysiphe neolycopersici]|uniref:Putative wd repeat protein n=1 Tax=Erysiphe neolycopersici TaxID=212602 RepID=A0A420I6T0_9PEZI|nr:putative wd repeat protein [Erysiphe neolycopersici]
MNTRGKLMRLLGQHAVNTTSGGDIDTGISRRPSASHSLAFCAGKDILCLDRSPDGQRVVIAGHGVFKVVKVEMLDIREEIDLRSIIWVLASNRNTAIHASEINNNLAIVAVKWLHGVLSNIIIAASANGIITAYNLNRASEGLEIARVAAHEREIYKVAISPYKPHWLLSASRDGTVKSWNIRLPGENSSSAYFRQIKTFKSTSDVLDVEWSPKDGMAFACCTEKGQILVWDLRDSTKPQLRINAHFGQCYSISWHPNGEHIASGGQDQFCHVWSLPKDGKKVQKPLYTIETRAPIAYVLWRPPLWSTTAHAKRAAQITVSYQDDRKLDSLVEIWDLARPTMPFKQLPYIPRPEQSDSTKRFNDKGWDTAPVGIIWNNRDILWTISNTVGTTDSGQTTRREGWLIQSNLSYVPNSIEQRSLSNLKFSPTGDVLMILEQRQAIRQQASIKSTGVYEPQQVMAIGHAPSAINSSEYQYYCTNYLNRLFEVPRRSEFPNELIPLILEDFARSAEILRNNRLAQTWRVLALSMGALLTRRAEYNRSIRQKSQENIISQIENETKDSKISGILYLNKQVNINETKSKRHHLQEIEKTHHTSIPEDVRHEPSSQGKFVLPNTRKQFIINNAKELRRTSDTSLFFKPKNIDPNHISDDNSPMDTDQVTTSSKNLVNSSFESEAEELYLELTNDKVNLNSEMSISPLFDFNDNSSLEKMKVKKPYNNTNEDLESNYSLATNTRNVESIPLAQSHTPDKKDKSFSQEVKNESELSSSFESEVKYPADESWSPGGQIMENALEKTLLSSLSNFDIQQNSAIRCESKGSSSSHTLSYPVSSRSLPGKYSFISEDFLFAQDEPPFTLSILDPSSIIQRLIIYHTATASTPLHLIPILLLLLPYLSPDTISHLHACHIITDVHARLNLLNLNMDATLLRNICVPRYPEVYAESQKNIHVDFICTECKKVYYSDLCKPKAQWKCLKCRSYMAPCPICEQHEYIPEEASFEWKTSSQTEDLEDDNSFTLGTWWYCPVCAHGGHVSCMLKWHAPLKLGYEMGTLHSNGACPVAGCLHPCLSGSWREELSLERAALVERKLSQKKKIAGNKSEATHSNFD